MFHTPAHKVPASDPHQPGVSVLKDRKPDFIFTDHGSVWLLRPENDAAEDHVDEFISHAIRLGTAVAIEARYAGENADRLVREGFLVEVHSLGRVGYLSAKEAA